jgi:hypothetical protein
LGNAPNQRPVIAYNEIDNIQQLFYKLKHNKKFCLDLRNVQDPLAVQIAIGSNCEQLMVGSLWSQDTWLKVNELKRTEEVGEFMYGCEDWCV